MSYQVLARKWRPRTFAELVGQEHVLKALVNALDNDRLHHAYLFTGTRGVGKTTIARILAKSLNCEQGISATPCGECSSCVEIAEGRFVDLIEVDAASRTKVEDTRELLENVQYRPTRGRYKVYLIDEVHMLSGHSFNALLKTLEEPPPHVKFLLATTDPQKLPVTILSRCLQFNLKHLGVERISKHLQHVLNAENVPFEEAALLALARGADGSMRDALSLADQAIAHGGGQITEVEVDAMLGTINRREVQELCRALAERDAGKVLGLAARMAEFSPDFGQALGEMLATWHRVAIAQQVPDAVDNSLGDHELVMELAQMLAPEDVQLFYQIGLLGRRDLPYAADPRSGFEMVLLRQLAFQPQGVTPPMGPPPGGRERAASDLAGAVPSQPVAATSSAGTQAAMASPAAASGSSSAEAEPTGAGERVNVSAQRRDSEEAYFRSASEQREPREPPQATAGQPQGVAASKFESAGEDAQRAPEEVSTVGDSSSDVESGRNMATPARGSPSPDQVMAVAEPGPAAHETGLANGGGAAALAMEPGIDGAMVTADQSPGDPWLELYPRLPLGGVLQNTAANLALEHSEGNVWQFVIDQEQSALFEEEHQERLAEVLGQHFSAVQKVIIRPGKPDTETPFRRADRIRAERQQAAVTALRQDPMVAELLARFSGELLEQTVRPRES